MDYVPYLVIPLNKYLNQVQIPVLQTHLLSQQAYYEV